MQRIKYTHLLFCMLSLYAITAQNLKNDVLICYGKFSPELVKNYKYVILESNHFTKEDITILKQTNEYVFAYISLGEVNQYANYFKTIEPYILEKNPNWNSYVIDIKNDPTKRILNDEISNILKLGVDGFFLDNIDNYTSFGPTPHLKEDLVSFLETIKKVYPELLLIQNAGLSILNDTKKLVDAVAVESVFTDYQFDTKIYRLRNKDEANYRIKEINTVRKQITLPFIFIEYSNSKSLTKKVKKLIPNTKNTSLFTSSIDLQNLPKK